MNTNHSDNTPRDELPDALRWQLRAMRRDQEPERDLWAGIAERIQAQPRQAEPPRRRWIAPVAMAATLVFAVGLVGLWRIGGQVPVGPGAGPAQGETLVQLEAQGMTRQYQAAMIEVGPGRPPAELQPAFDELDRNAALILDALAHDPDSRLLLEQLRKTYARRLALAQRVAYA
ncbi:hypothetical protein [Lysobacter arvi]|uniref:Anti-sigma factor n=1 Tax=Lysobacter arvi TaxID=3038776 RepID=A0ABU1CD64_9GAMM|nr:hypothetical protein [Lysobacter arvi]MDR0183030.1 hypothetical protein [Lysobacter arvi]